MKRMLKIVREKFNEPKNESHNTGDDDYVICHSDEQIDNYTDDETNSLHESSSPSPTPPSSPNCQSLASSSPPSPPQTSPSSSVSSSPPQILQLLAYAVFTTATVIFCNKNAANAN